MSACLFCQIVAGELPSTLVAENERAIAFRDVAPQAPVHVLVIPKRHVADFHALGGEEGELALDVFSLARQVAAELGVAESGYRVVMNVGKDAQMAVGHLHLHVLGGRPMAWPPG